MIYVIAGSYTQYENWRRESGVGRTGAFYVSTSSQLRGRTITDDDKVVRYGTWSARKDLREIEENLIICSLRSK